MRLASRLFIMVVLPAGFLVHCTSAPSDLPGGRLIDLTYAFDAATIYWPTARPFTLEKVAEGMTAAGYYYAANNFAAAEHGGTHLDSPIHFAAGGHTTDEIPLERLVGRAVVVDVTAAAAADRDYQVQIADFERWEQQHGRLPAKSIVLLRTGHGQYWPEREKYLGTAETGPQAVARLHFPGLHPQAAAWLVQRQVKAVGIDTPSIDHGQSTLFESHQTLFRDNIPVFENVAQLDQLPATGALVFALPMKIKGGSGGPLRIIALVP